MSFWFTEVTGQSLIKQESRGRYSLWEVLECGFRRIRVRIAIRRNGLV